MSKIEKMVNRKVYIFWIWISVLGLTTAQESQLVATASIMQDIVSRVAGPDFPVESIVPLGGDPHIYNPTPSDAQLISQAELIFKNGLTFEGWLNKLIENSGTDAEIILMTKGVPTIRSLKYKNSTDPHAWMDVSQAMSYAKNSLDALIKWKPEKTKVFKSNYEEFIGELKALDAWVYQQIEGIPAKKRVLITSHDAFQYYGRRYGLELVALLGTTTDAEVQTSDVMRVTETIRERQLPAIFIESTINPKLMKQLAQDNKVSIGGKLYADSLSDEKGPANNYIDMIRYNTNTIVKALSAPASVNEHKKDTSQLSGMLYWIIPVLLIVMLSGFYFARKN